MKNLIIENDPRTAAKDDFLQLILARRFKENRETWTNFQTAFSPVNLDATISKFLSLEDGDVVVFEEAIVEFSKWDLMVGILDMLRNQGKRITIYVLHDHLTGLVDKYHISDKHERTEEKFFRVIQYHKIFQLGMTEDRDVQVKLPTAEAEEKEEERKLHRMYADNLGCGNVIFMQTRSIRVPAYR